MKGLIPLWQHRHWLLTMLLPGVALLQVLPGVTQETLQISNTGSVIFRAPNSDTPRTVPSNPTTFTAVTDVADLEVVKTGDRSAAEPGDTVTYRLLVRNTGTAAVNNLVVQDVLPLGMQFVGKSLQGTVGSGTTSTPVALPEPTTNNRTIAIAVPNGLAPQQTLNLTYSVVLTPDAIRGSGRNLASAIGNTGTREIRSNTASFLVRIRPGILSDCGTILGRVFVDKNFDGEQQPGEPGVPNAVVFMDDGNRIVTDPNGLFSVANVIAGNRTGAIDLSSLPGYTLAPNLYRIEANSQSRLVRLSPGGLARMNFAVTPAFGEQSTR
ncbi:DUF11 domain-containing protein [Trichocoleus sp. FACHB-262]|uniref:DUF11 domain-containing protein n=2 Tax=Trichocoleusaceae TaxID=2303527 RepID=A0ABV0JD95_9CYAN|nr:DUF11 domain-containing protein [Trichocoleus sp. FACHB-262]MBD1864403.1 DUF11 domain-containing protein [Trichocoleus sp. FACHB-46]MBD2123301.1 DUF11 domain-containing protein [Trichocoleus sp. FACHB-262]